MKNKLRLLVRYLTQRNPEKKLNIDLMIMSWFWERGLKSFAKYWKNRIYYVYNVDIAYQAKISKSVRFTHPVGIVIGDRATIDDGVTILQNVTLGGSFNSGSKQHIEQGTIICAGAKIIGTVHIGKNCIIGANAVVTKDVDDGLVVSGYNKIVGTTENYK
jgi:serine O-acetyltransferase